MKKLIRPIFLLMGVCLFATEANAQLSSNPDKFLGNITTSWNNDMDTNGRKYHEFWNQVTPENASKWASVQGNRNNFNWGGADKAFNYAKQWGFTHKFHALIWGAQYPDWLPNLPAEERYQAIVTWFDAVKGHYPNLPLIDVVNEAVWSDASNPHQPGNPMMRESLGGKGKTGYDWLIRAFEMAYERWPDAILIYNDYNSIQWQINQYIDLVTCLRNAGAPIDAYGLQCHELTDISKSTCESALTRLDNELKMPMYSTEFDIGTSDDQKQLTQYKNLIPLFWERDNCAGVTLWGWIYGSTWTTDGNSGLIRDGKERPAMTWLREYMATDAAKNAKSPFPGMVKEASIYIKPAALKVAKEDKLPILVRASMKTKTIEKVELYAGSDLIATMTEAPYKAEYIPTTAGTKTLKAVVTTTDGATFERLSRVTVLSDNTPHTAFQGKRAEVPGIIEAENFDQGAKDVAYHDSDSRNSGDADYRPDAPGVDIIKTGDGYAIGSAKTDEWLDYSVDVKEAGLYSIDIDVAAEKGGLIHFAENTLGNMNFIADIIRIPKTGKADNFETVHIRMTRPLQAGNQIFTLHIDEGEMSIDKITFTPLEIDKTMKIAVTAEEKTIVVDNSTQITVKATSTSSSISNVKIYENGMYLTTLTEAPYQFNYTPTTRGTKVISAIATDVDGKESKIAQYTIDVKGKRTPYGGDAITLPGIIEAENFDQGGDGLSFHDSDDVDEGNVNYRSDNEGVDIVNGNGSKAIGYTAANEWLEYSVNVTEPGEYILEATVSSGLDGSAFTVRRTKGQSTATLCKVEVPNTGSWNTYKVVKIDKLNMALDEGEQIIRIIINNAYCNIDKIELKPVSTGIDKVTTDRKAGKAYNLKGQQTNANHKGIIILNGKKFVNK